MKSSNMKRMKVKVHLVGLPALVLMIMMSVTEVAQAQLPQSKEAKIVETVSSAEVLVEATGEFESPKEGGGLIGKTDAQKHIDEVGVKKATMDAKKSAVYHLLFGGTDPMLGDAEEREKFRMMEEEFFEDENIERFIVFEEDQLRQSVKYQNGEAIRVTKRFKVNKSRIKEHLVQEGIVEETSELAEEIGNPFVAVLPSAPEGTNPIELMKNDQMAKQGVSVIESYLTARQYDVVVPEQQEQLGEMTKAQNMVSGAEEDLAYQLALSIGSDVYITFSGSIEDAGYGTEKVAAQVRAYETTTARLLGSETGYSKGRSGEVSVSVEEAINDAIDKVLNRVNNYWKEDLERGLQYKVIFNISPEFEKMEAEEVSFALLDAVDAIAEDTKENVFTNKTVDLLLWCSPDRYDRSSRLYIDLKRNFEYSGAQLMRSTINRKMLILNIKPDY